MISQNNLIDKIHPASKYTGKVPMNFCQSGSDAVNDFRLSLQVRQVSFIHVPRGSAAPATASGVRIVRTGIKISSAGAVRPLAAPANGRPGRAQSFPSPANDRLDPSGHFQPPQTPGSRAPSHFSSRQILGRCPPAVLDLPKWPGGTSPGIFRSRKWLVTTFKLFNFSS